MGKTAELDPLKGWKCVIFIVIFTKEILDKIGRIWDNVAVV